jgi:hypothetical protein
MDRTFIVETIEDWKKLSAKLKKYGYIPSGDYQYGAWTEEGLHAWFTKDWTQKVEVITHNEEVHKAIYKFKAPGD